MRIGICDCKHCGTEYEYQFSGSWDAIDVPREYRDREYCPECMQAVVGALKAIPRKFAYKDVETDEVDLDTLLRWEKEDRDEHEQKMKDFEVQGKVLLPKSVRIFAGLRNLETGEHDIIREVIGREDKKGRIYIYCYWSSDKSKQRITVERRVNLLTGELLQYKIRN